MVYFQKTGGKNRFPRGSASTSTPLTCFSFSSSSSFLPQTNHALQLPPVNTAAASMTAASRVEGWLSATAEASGPAAAAATALAAAEADAKAAAAAAATASSSSLRPPLPACWRARARATPGAGALARLTSVTAKASAGTAATATATLAIPTPVTTAASAPPASVAASFSSLPCASPFARHASTPFEVSEDEGEGGADAMLPPPALAAVADASAQGQQLRSRFPSLLLLAPLERVGRGVNAWDNCAEDYGCNSSDSEWYREEEEEEEEEPIPPPPSADLLLPWQL